MKTMKLLLVVLVMLCGCKTKQIKIYFDDLSTLEVFIHGTSTAVPVISGEWYHVGDYFHVIGTDVYLDIRSFRWSDGSYTSSGYVQFDPTNHAGGQVYELHFNNATIGLREIYGFVPKAIKFKYADLGGNINLLDSVEWYQQNNFENILGSSTVPVSGTTSGGINMTVNHTGGVGILALSGEISHLIKIPVNCDEEKIFLHYKYFSLVGGGQELWIDELILKQ
jgi:hypothetical protein